MFAEELLRLIKSSQYTIQVQANAVASYTKELSTIHPLDVTDVTTNHQSRIITLWVQNSHK